MGSFVNESVTTPCIFWADTEMQHPNNKIVETTNTSASFNSIEKIKRIEIYNISGALVQVVENPFSKGNNIQLRNLNKGVYILKAENTTQKFIVE